MLLLLLILAMVFGWGFFRIVNDQGGLLTASAVIGAPLLFIFIACGFYMLQPNQAAAITLFGDYRGTDRSTGLRWVLPWMMRKKVSVRANNFISEKIKVNDLRGNPIEMAAQIVWRVVDTAQALFDVDDYREFVRVQVEAAIRTIGARYPYDDFEHQDITLRGHHDEVGGELRQELIARVGRLINRDPALESRIQILHRIEVCEAGRVIEKLMKGHLVSPLPRVIRQVRFDRFAQVDLPLFLKLENQDRREDLGDRGDLVLRLVGIRNLERNVRQPEALRVADLPILLDQDRTVEVVLFGIIGDEAVRRCWLRERDNQKQNMFHRALRPV